MGMSRITVDCHYSVKVEGIVLVGNRPVCGVLIMCQEREQMLLLSALSLSDLAITMSLMKCHIPSSMSLLLCARLCYNDSRCHMVLDKITG